MKIILSRKGFDSGYGGCPSPIFCDESMASFPIPDAKERLHSMNGMLCGGHDLGKVVQDLAAGLNPVHAIGRNAMIHLDPDLRDAGGMGQLGGYHAFGQDGAAQSHLSNQLVGCGDLFLFFGWFRRVQMFEGHWRFVPKSPEAHVIFGWLQVGEVLKVSDYQNWRAIYPWLKDHPHVRNARRYPENNTIYLASEKLAIDSQPTRLLGGGAFRKFSPLRQLTHPTQRKRQKKSVWQLPHWFSSFDAAGKRALTYHGNPIRWPDDTKLGATVELHSVARGQEFVLNLDSVPVAAANKWLKKLFSA